MDLDSNLFSSESIISPTPQPIKPPTPAIAESDLREFGDVDRTRSAIYGNVLKAAQSLEPVSNGRHTLRLTNVDYIDPDRFSKQQQKQAILNRTNLARRMQGVWELIDDATGQVIDKKKSVIMSVPHMTERGTFINKGTEYALKNQQRLLPGVYTRIRDNGEVEAHANILPGKGQSHRYYLDPEKGTFRIRLGQGTVGLMPLLKAMGASKEQLMEAWGRDLYASNFTADDPQEYRKLKEKFLTAKELQGDENQQREALVKKFQTMELSPEVTKRTLGREHANITLDTILDLTKRLIRVSKKEEDPDDRDSLPFQQFFGPEDLFAERISRDKDNIRRTLLWKMSQKGNLRNMPSSALSKQLYAALLTSGLGIAAEEINTAELLDKATSVTRLGEGGIPSIDSIPDEARSVQPSMFGFIDPLRTPESSRAGVDTYLTRGARKGPDNKLYVKFLDARTGTPTYKTAQELADLTLGFPTSMQQNTPRVPAMRGGKMIYVPKNQIDLLVPSMEDTFNHLSNLIPSKSQVKGQRLVMATRMTTQALPVVDAESPLVQSAVPGTQGAQSFEELYADKMGALRAQKNGRVLSVSPDEIKVQYEDGTIDSLDVYNNFPLNRKTRVHQDPVVQPGQTFQANQLLAKSNYTDKTGATALGRNARTAYMAWEGKNFEDAVVISKSFAKKMTSEHIYQHDLEVNDKTAIGKKKFIQHFPSKYDKKTLESFDDTGVIKPGTEVKYGDPLILGISQKDVAHNRVHKQGQISYSDSSVTWDHHDPGVVTDVVMGKSGPTVVVKSLAEMRIGDKISGRYGDKGVLADIIDDEDMPRDANGQPYEVLANPLGLVTRTNPSQMAELWLGKIAAMQGKPIKVEDFDTTKDMMAWVEEQLKQNGLKDYEDVIDPKNERKIKNIATGNRFFMKLHHLAEAKSQGRGGGSYTAEGAPAKGGSEGSKRIGLLDSNALLAHGATDTLQDVISLRSHKNEDYWMQFMSGHNPKVTKVPFVYEKFVNQLKASGVNVVRKGTQQQLMALTDKDIDELSAGRELTNASGVDWGSGLKELPGGLFDKSKTGGHGGTQWSYFKLHEPMPNPVMEEPIRRILGLTQKKFESILSGEEQLNNYGTGPKAIKSALENINLDKEIEMARNTINVGKASQRDAAVRKLGYLKSAQKLGLNLSDYMLSKVPVIPPMFRPVSVMSNDLPLINDANYLYKELFEANNNLSKIQENLGADGSGPERLAVYRAFKAVTGLGDPIGVKTKEKNIQGFLKTVFGSSPKFGCYDDKTEILTQQGWVNFAEYRGNVPVATLNPNTNAFEWQLPTDVYHWDYNGELFEFSTARGLDSVVTPNHRNFVRNRVGNKSADNMSTGWCIEPAYVTAADGGRKWFRTAASGWVGHRLRPKFLPLSCKLKDFAAFVGWWVAEGWLADRKKDCIQLCQAVKNKANCKRIAELVDSLGLPYSKGKYLRKGKFGECWVWQWSIRSKELAQWLTTNAGLLAENKVLSNKIKDWDTPFLREFLLGYLGGDGTRRYLPRRNKGGITHKNHSSLLDHKQNANTTSERLAGNIQEIACKLGITARLVLRPREEVNWHDLHRINLSGSAFVVTEGKDKAKVIKYTGQVHCVSVPNGIVYVRRNGKPLFSGNSLQRKLISTTVDNVGRGVISPDPNLDMDQVGLPEDKAFKIYERFVTRNLVRRGMSLREAREQVKDKTKLAREMLVEEMDRRPVYISRAPVLHKFGVLAMKPQITKGDTLRISPLVVKGFNADFDGDAMNYHVPSSDEAVKEAYERLLPSKNLFSLADFKSVMHKPANEYITGLYFATQPPNDKPKRIFRKKEDVIRAYERGDLSYDDKIQILEP